MLNRRHLLAAGAAALAPGLGWAGAGSPAYLAAARHGDGRYWLHGLSEAGDSLFALPLPDRGHAAAAHPTRPLAVAFARRPGRFALIIDCAAGRAIARLDAPPGRDFSGHGAFSAEGAALFTVENDHDRGEGVLGVWDSATWQRRGEVRTGGVGPHEAILSADGRHVIVANGGILTGPDSGRAKLNVPDMRPSVALVEVATGRLDRLVEPEPALRLNSLRHLAVRSDGTVAVAAQWEGDPFDAPPLLALLRPGAAAFDWCPAPTDRAARGYAGSVAFSGDGRRVAWTSPRGGLVQLFDTETGQPGALLRCPDGCGIAALGQGLAVTDGLGGIWRVDGTDRPVPARLAAHPCAWDNHLVRIRSGRPAAVEVVGRV
jgi:hypothetical protein